ncbi:hypothetical protein [Fusobacterium sp.]|uniref:major outer membrane protein FomA n=1 Tax=Fusobacterium sp. TaxID=68766 RepID=UPI00396CC958
MKRLALILGSLLVVSAAASAKEVVPAPVVVEETPVQIVEKEVIVYREKAPEWRPSGFLDIQERYYGKTENQKEGWNPHNQYGRLQVLGKVQMTENQAIELRSRTYQGWNKLDQTKADQFRLRYFYDHGTVGDTKIDAQSMVKYEKNAGGSQKAEYKLTFDFAEYLFNNDFIKTDTAVVGPRYIYEWEGHGNGYTNTLGLYMDLINQFPLGFSTEIEVDGLDFNKYQNAIDQDGHKKDFTVSVAAKLMHNWNLYSTDNYSVDWAFEGGYDNFDYSNRKIVKTSAIKALEELNKDKTYYGVERAKYELYAQPSIVLTYNATEFVSLYGAIGAEYRNWAVTANTEASHWRWQPYAILGVKTTF